MTTPADWYPDPERPGQLRYWDGTLWTEHRAPAPTPAPAEPPPPSEQPTSVVSLPDDPEPSSGGGSHRAPDVAPPSEAPSAPPSYAPPPGASYGAPSWGAPATGQSFPPPSGASWDTSQFAPPPGPPGGDGPNKKLVIGILGGAAALILVLAVALVYVFVIRDDDATVTASPSSSSSAESSARTTSSRSSAAETTTSEAASPTRTAGPVTDGNLTFTITDIEAAESVTSTFSDAVGKTAQGTYAIVHLTVGNVGTDPVTFLATFQRLNGSGQSLAPDDEATVFAGGGYADVAPGAEVETIVVFDVPDDVEPESMFFQENPVTPGVDLPF